MAQRLHIRFSKVSRPSWESFHGLPMLTRDGALDDTRDKAPTASFFVFCYLTSEHIFNCVQQ
jgi:hypothetical protein